MYTPNIYADTIEWFLRTVRTATGSCSRCTRTTTAGCAVAAAELGVLAGADRVEGTLFGNGERTGNVDIVTLAMNLFSQGIDPELDITDIDALRRTAEYCNRLPVHERHPYVGDLVYTAFSGSHQDAIKKGIEALPRDYEVWEVPYLPIDPKHVGRTYEAVIRVNSQSGKGGVAYIMEAEHGFDLPRRLQIEFSKTIQAITEDTGTEISPAAMWDAFQREYLPETVGVRAALARARHRSADERTAHHRAAGRRRRAPVTVVGEGNGPIAAFVDALRDGLGVELDVVDYAEHAIGRGRRRHRGRLRRDGRRRRAPCGGASATTRTSSRPRCARCCRRSARHWGRRRWPLVLVLVVVVAVLVMRRRRLDEPSSPPVAPPPPPPRWVVEPTPGYDIKVKLSSGIFHRPGMLAYERTQADRWYASGDDAAADGFRAAKR